MLNMFCIDIKVHVVRGMVFQISVSDYVVNQLEQWQIPQWQTVREVAECVLEIIILY